MTTICLRCIAITERIHGSDRTWSVSFEPVPVNGDAPAAYSSRGELTLQVYREAFARSFQVGEFYSADLARIDAPGQ